MATCKDFTFDGCLRIFTLESVWSCMKWEGKILLSLPNKSVTRKLSNWKVKELGQVHESS